MKGESLLIVVVVAAREKHNKATSALSNIRNDIKRNEDTLRKMDKDFGPDAEWKKLDGTCIETEYGEYVELNAPKRFHANVFLVIPGNCASLAGSTRRAPKTHLRIT